MAVSPLAGKPVDPSMLVDIPKLVTAYYMENPDPSIPEQRVAFGTSGHRGSPFDRTFNEHHILATTEAICRYRKRYGIEGPLFLGRDTHAVSYPAFVTALQVLAAHDLDVMVAVDDYTPTPAVSHAILTHNQGRITGLADGIVITPSHNPPQDGGFKYNPPNGGPADTDVTNWIQSEANHLLENRLDGVRQTTYDSAMSASTTHRHDYLDAYVSDLAHVVDIDAIRNAGITLGVDPLGGASVRYWEAIVERYRLDLTIVRSEIDPAFRFMTLDWDGKIRMDPSSEYAMQSMIGLKDRFDVAFACDTDADRHGIVTKSAGLMQPNHYLAVAIDYLFTHRPSWKQDSAIGKTVVSSSMIDRVTERLGRSLYEVPVGFKWFADGLVAGSLGFGGEESAGASFLRTDGSVWTTDKDGIIAALLSAEITARTGRDPGELYKALSEQFGEYVYERIDAPATPQQKDILKRLSSDQIQASKLAGDPIETILTTAPGNRQPIGGVKVMTRSGWFAARPSGTESAYKIYAESLRGREHLQKIEQEAQDIVTEALAGSAGTKTTTSAVSSAKSPKQ